MNHYEEPKMEVIEFDAEDVIVTSGDIGIDLPNDPASLQAQWMSEVHV